MARSVDEIQADIESTRNQLADTLDVIADRTSPKNIASEIGDSITNALKNPKVQAGFAIGAVVIGGMIFASSRNRKKRQEQLDQVQQLIAQARSDQ